MEGVAARFQKSFDKLKKKFEREDYQQMRMEIPKYDYFLNLNINPPEIPTDIRENLAEIPELLEEAVDEHYRGKIYEEVLHLDME